MVSRRVSRRRFVAATAATSTVFVAAPFVRGAYAAGKLSVGFWDHWVPGANGATEKLIHEWADKEKVEVQLDFITSQGNKLLLTTAAESQAKSGHDILAMNTFLPARYAEQLVPMNDVMEALIKENGAVNATVEYLGKVNGKWLAIPATIGSQIKGPCSRIDYMKQFASIDVQAMYPAGAPPKADAWTLDAFLKAAEACHKGGHAFGIGLGTTSDSVDSIGAFFHAYGAVLVDAKGEIVRQERSGPPGARLLQEADGVPAARRSVVGRRLQQQVAGVGPGRDDHEPAERLGGRQARRAEGRGAVLDARLPVRTQGPLRAVPAVLLGHLELQQEPGGGQEPAGVPLAGLVGREDGGGQRRLRPAVLREADDLQDLGRGRAAEGHALPLSQSLQSARSSRSLRRRRRTRSPSRSTPRAS